MFVERQSIGLMDGAHIGNNLISILEACATLYPAKVALRWVPKEHLDTWDGVRRLDHVGITYRELSEKVSRMAKGLKDNGLVQGDRVMIFLRAGLELYLAMFSIVRIGAIAVFVDPWATKEQIDSCAMTTKPKAMIIDVEAYHVLCGLPYIDAIPLKIVAGVQRRGREIALADLDASQGAAVEAVEGNAAALITFTTGSTAKPKGVIRTHRHLAAQHRALTEVLPLRQDDIELTTFPIFLLNSLASGVTTIIPAISPTAPDEKDASVLANQIASCGVTTCTFSPSFLVQLADHIKKNGVVLPTLARVVTGGAPVTKRMVRTFRTSVPSAAIIVLYGSTEAEPVAHVNDNEYLAHDSNREGLLVGYINKDLQYKFIKKHKGAVELGAGGWREWEVPEYDIGELIVCGPHVCGEYCNDIQATKMNKIQGLDGKVWHRTGDLGFVDDKNRLWIVGRVHNVIERKHVTLYSYRPEMLLGELEFVRQAAFIGLKDNEFGEKACAVISLTDGYSPEDRKTFVGEIQRTLADHNIPIDDVRIVTSIPMDPRHRSKVDYIKLKEMLK